MSLTKDDSSRAFHERRLRGALIDDSKEEVLCAVDTVCEPAAANDPGLCFDYFPRLVRYEDCGRCVFAAEGDGEKIEVGQSRVLVPR